MVINANESLSHKVVIATFINEINYGALLQAYALGTYLAQKVKNISYISVKKTKPSRYSGIKRLFYLLVAKRRISQKEKLFTLFIKKHFSVLETLSKNDVLICGSDQVWNIEITNGYEPLFWGEQSKQCIGYAVSCGDLCVLEKTVSVFREKLKNFTAVSAREIKLSKFIEKEGQIPCPVVCDPTFLLRRNDYKKIENPNHLFSKPYILIYQMNKDALLYSLAGKIAKERNLKIVEINNNLFEYAFRKHKCYYSCSVEDFLALVRDASFIVTNSFHGTVFSLLYQKPFYAVKSIKRNDRIVDLLSLFGLEDRILERNHNVNNINPSDIAYELVADKIQLFSNKSKLFLINALRYREVDIISE